MTNTNTKHTCGGPVFGHKTPGCPRCDELLAGSAPRQQAWRTSYVVSDLPRDQRSAAARVYRGRMFDGRTVNGIRYATDDAARCAEIRAHRCGPSCGSVCTFGEW